MFRSLLAAALVAAFATVAHAADKVRFAVTDIEGLEALQQEFGAFQGALSKATGLDIELIPVSSRTAAVEAMNSGQVELVLTGPAEYVVMKELTGAEIVVGWQRPDYFAQIVSLATGDVRSAEDLRGKIVSFGSVGSTSQHLGPAQALADLGLAYGTDYEPQIISRNVAIEALMRGDIAAIGMNFGHLRRARAAYPNVPFTVIARGRDLPNDILVASPNMDKTALQKVQDAFVESGGDLMAAVLQGEDNKKYDGGFFLATINDGDYDYVRSMYRTIGIDTFKQFVGD
ncbi:MAG: PhnD/SsuA/transferrin family substrate-binding protein [Pseudomonadota bacterium]